MKKAARVRLIGFCFFSALFLTNPVLAQFSNNWVNYSQSYYKIPVAKDGIYKISYADLQAAGVPIGSIDPRSINLFHRGNEQAIFVQGQADAQFDPTDFIEFYGTRNDGTLDAELYLPGTQPHTYYSLFNDTSAYFLTWNPLSTNGKRMSSFSQINSSSLPVQTYHNATQLVLYTTDYAGGYTEASEIQGTVFDIGEGWTGGLICTFFNGCTGFKDFVIDNLDFSAASSGPPQLEVLLVGREVGRHVTQISVGQTNGSLRVVGSTSYGDFANAYLSIPINASDIGANGKMTVRVFAQEDKDIISVSYIRVTFPQQWNQNTASDKVFNVVPDANDKSYVEILNPPSGARVWDITDPDNVGTIGTTSVGGGIGAIVPGTASGKKLYVSGATLSTSLSKIGFRNIPAAGAKYIIISHRSLMKPGLGYPDAVKAYAGYRASVTGGGYDTLTVTMDQLYNQFNYGEISPRAIFQFMKYMVNGGDPAFLFLIGKGLEVSQGYYRKTSFLPTDFRDLVPSAGMPGADIAFTAGLAGSSYEPAVPTGRLTASTPVQVAAYLNKVKETEALPYDALWRKDILHLSGGINAGEPQLFRSYVDGFKSIAEDIYLGGSVQTISKQTLNVELVNVKDQVNKGLNLITFFGHSGPGTIDVDIGYVSDPTLGYNNPSKYPSFLINGCNAGRFFDNRVTFGEDWMLTTGKGAKAFIAHSSFGFTTSLRQYSDLFYTIAFADSAFMKKGIGEIQKEVGRRYINQSGVSLTTITIIQQMMLLGDPAVQLFGARHPDFAVDNSSLSIQSLDGKPVTSQSSSFALDVDIKNFGRTYTGPLLVRVTRTLNDNTRQTYDTVINPIYYEGTLRFKINRGRNAAEFGNNNFSVEIDPNNASKETTRTNNVASLNFFIPLNGTKNLYPSPYAIINNTHPDLVFQNTDLISDVRSFRVEVDTAATFNSGYLMGTDVSGKVLAKLSLNLLPGDSTVYYWRTKLNNPKPDESTEWATSSFIYINNGPEGWGQFKFPQLNEDQVTGLVKDAQSKRIKFQEVISTIDVTTFGSANATNYQNVSIKINQEEFNIATQGQSCRNNTLNMMVFDKSSTAPYVGLAFSFFDPRDCGRTPQMINSFQPSEMDLGNGQDLVQTIQNINPGDSVVLFSIGDAGYASWTVNAKNALAQLGIGTTQLSSLQSGEPFVIFAKKGSAAGSANVFRPSGSPANLQQLDVHKTNTGGFTEGTLESVVIGPAQQWFQLKQQITEATVNDFFGVDVTGIDLSGNETVLKTQLTGIQSLTDINATTYPFIRLTLHVKDEQDLTAAQLRKWLVTYTPVAEGMLTYSGPGGTESVQEGQSWKTTYGFTNFSNKAFTDSLTVKVSIFSAQAKATEQKSFRIRQPAPGDTTKFSFTVNTKGKAGPNDISVFVNPKILPEMYYDNNTSVLYSYLQVIEDLSGPLLDVTVDGRRLVNGDHVSPTPVILTRIVDGNPYLFKTDTTGINLYLQYPCALAACPYIRINFTRPDVTWKPATATSEFQVAFSPKLPLGEYRLKVEGQDAKGNLSGPSAYEVKFVVSDKSGVSLQSVYPNPASDNFYFRIFVGGASVPSDFQMQVYSSTGQIVRTFGNEMLSSFHIGTNDLVMTATDASGNPLPNGIYMFRMVSLQDGKSYTSSGRLLVVR